MIETYGARFGLSDGIRYDQTKCFIDVFLKDLKVNNEIKFWLETCNVHAVACACEAVASSAFKYTPPSGPDGRPLMSQAGLMFLYLYSRYGQVNAPCVSEGVAENEIKKNLCWVAEQCADVTATLHEFKTTQAMVEGMDASLRRGSANVLSYLTDYGSGHFHAQTARRVNGAFIAYDSWAANQHCKNGGVREEYDASFYIQRCIGARMNFIEIAETKERV
jgi:hypothetical protein